MPSLLPRRGLVVAVLLWALAAQAREFPLDYDVLLPKGPSFWPEVFTFGIPRQAYVFGQDSIVRPWDVRQVAEQDVFGGGTQFTLHLECLSDSDWTYPLPGAHVISPYGWRGDRPHTGTDIKTMGGDSVRAAFAGVVFFSGEASGYGNCIRISHANGLTTLYSHNARNLVAAGQYVRVGQVLALEGCTGRATTEHVHFEIRVDNRPYNSDLVFDHDAHLLRRHPIVFHRNGQARVLD